MVICLATLPQVIQAQGDPPPEAIQACQNKSQGDACAFTAPGGATITGTCGMVQDIPACVPGGGPPTVTATTPTTQTPTATPTPTPSTPTASYPVVGTGQTACYDNSGAISCPQTEGSFYGQDAQHAGNQPSYVDNGDGTVTDLNTGLMWQQTPGDKVTWSEAVAGADIFSLAGYDDWRLPSIKELYSLIDFSGIDPSGYQGGDTSGLTPFIDTAYFDFEYGDTSAGERIIDAQYWSSTEYVGATMNGTPTTFGVNFADGRIKGYGRERPGGGEMTQFVRYVRGNTDYGVNDFVANGDPSTVSEAASGQAGAVTDRATGLMWSRSDSGAGMTWEEALAWVQQKNAESYLGHDDWRLPDAKELQSIVDYARSPSTTGSAAIDPIFDTTSIVDEGGGTNYPFYWTSTTHANWSNSPGRAAAYVAFGEALGYMEQPPNSGNYSLQDVHGAGAQRSDPKSGDPADWPHGHGPQGDVIRIYNYVRLVRDVGQSSLPGDVNDDCVVDIVDIMLMAVRWGTRVGDANYDPYYDLDDDGDIDIVDIMQVAAHWGDVCD